jgi:hypothetical protein
MFSRVRNHFKDSKLSRMSSGDYCVIRDLGLVKGGKGLRHHEVLLKLSMRGLLEFGQKLVQRLPDGVFKRHEMPGAVTRERRF